MTSLMMIREAKAVSVTYPVDGNRKATTLFSYTTDADGSGATEVKSPIGTKSIYHFDQSSRLTGIEQYLNGDLYRSYRKYWGEGIDLSHLIGTSIEDGSGTVLLHRSYAYDDEEKGNIIEEEDHGNLTGANPCPVQLTYDGTVYSYKESLLKSFSYKSRKIVDIINQLEAKGNGLRLVYKKGTNLLFRKAIVEKGIRQKRWIYEYNDDGALTQLSVDDHDGEKLEDFFNATERHITKISPKTSMPNVGAPEVIEEKCLNIGSGKEILIGKTVNHFDEEGNVVSQDIYDAKGEFRYFIKKTYSKGLLTSETDSLGNQVLYSYDKNQNLISETFPSKGLTVEYDYNLKNQQILKKEQDVEGKGFSTKTPYDLSGNKISETDRLGSEITYKLDSLGRIASAIYPQVKSGQNSTITPIYLYEYDLFDNVTSSKDPEGNVTRTEYNFKSKPISIEYPDGSRELFKYDPEGSLHRHLGKDGITRVFEYDYLSRITHIEYYDRKSIGEEDGFKADYYWYNAFHLLSKEDDEGKFLYNYDHTGKLQTSIECKKRSECWQIEDEGVTEIENGNRTDFLYDSLGFTRGVKKSKNSKDFSLYIKEKDFLGRVTEERIENTNGKILAKTKYTYSSQAEVSQVIGFPNNRERILTQYEYDTFNRPCKIVDAFGKETIISYDDGYINELGLRVHKRTQIDPKGVRTEEVFDAAENLAKTRKINSSGKLLSEEEYFYNSRGNQTFEVHNVLSSCKSLRTYELGQEFSTGGQVKQVFQGSGPSCKREVSFRYSRYGDLSRERLPGFKNPLISKYDFCGYLDSLEYPREGLSPASYTYWHDDRGLLEKVETDEDYCLSFEREANGQVLSETVEDQIAIYSVNYTYDGEGLIENIKLPDGSSIKYSYDGPFIQKVVRVTKNKKDLYSYQVTSRDQMGLAIEEKLIGKTGKRFQSWDASGRKNAISTDYYKDKIGRRHQTCIKYPGENTE